MTRLAPEKFSATPVLLHFYLAHHRGQASFTILLPYVQNDAECRLCVTDISACASRLKEKPQLTATAPVKRLILTTSSETDNA